MTADPFLTSQTCLIYKEVDSDHSLQKISYQSAVSRCYTYDTPVRISSPTFEATLIPNFKNGV